MRKILGTTVLISLLLLLMGGGGCLEDKVTELVLTDETFMDFEESHTSASWTTPFTLDNYGSQLDSALVDAGYSRSNILSAQLVAAFYGVTDFSQAHDWRISGTITVQRTDGTPGLVETLIDYTSVSVDSALGLKIPASLDPAGVAVINQALTDFITGSNPVLVFRVENGSVSPIPDAQDPLIFDWRAWIKVQVVIDAVVEDWPLDWP
jgi:hypothetical protein